MTKKIKILFGSIVLALGFFFCFCMVSVNAEELPATDEQVNVVGVYYVDEQEGKAEFTLYSNNTFSATAHDNASNEDRDATGTYLIEGNIVTFDFENGKTFKAQISGNKLTTPQEEIEQPQEEVVEDVKSAFAWFKSLDAETVKGWLIAIASYLGANVLVLLALVIKLVLSKTKEYKQTEFWNQVVAKMDQEHQEKVEKLVEEFNTKMVELQGDLKQEIAKLDDEKKKVAANNIAVLKDNLNDIKEDLEK